VSAYFVNHGVFFSPPPPFSCDFSKKSSQLISTEINTSYLWYYRRILIFKIYMCYFRTAVLLSTKKYSNTNPPAASKEVLSKEWKQLKQCLPQTQAFTAIIM